MGEGLYQHTEGMSPEEIETLETPKDKVFKDYTTRSGTSLQNLGDGSVFEEDSTKKLELLKVCTCQAVDEVIWTIELYLKTKDKRAQTFLHHDIAYLRWEVRKYDPRVADMLDQIYETAGDMGTDKEIDYANILGEFIEAKKRLSLDESDYFTLGERLGYSEKELLIGCIAENFRGLVTVFVRYCADDLTTEAKNLKIEWENSRRESFESFIEKSENLLPIILKNRPELQFYNEYYRAFQAIEKARKIVNKP